MDAIRFFRLQDTSLIDADPVDDLRGCQVIDANGTYVGSVEDSLADEEEERVRLVEIAVDEHLDPSYPTVLVPLDLVEREHETLRLKDSVDHMLTAPLCSLYSPQQQWEKLYSYFHCTPFWDPEYMERDLQRSLTTRG